MKTVEIIGYNRANLGKKDAKDLRLEGNVPSVLYGGKDQIHFYAPMILFKPLVYTPDAYFVELNVESKIFKAILQDIQFHPVSETIMHADFLLLDDKKKITMDIPVNLEGVAPGVLDGGKLQLKQRKMSIKAFPGSMPETINVDITGLDLNKSIKVGELEAGEYEILNSPLVSIVSVVVPRALKGAMAEGEEGEEEVAEEEA